MKLLKDLIKINTYEGDYTKIIKCITDYLRQNIKCRIEIQEISSKKANIIATIGQPRLALNCHMDTVPPVKGWNKEPLRLTEDETFLYGLGTCDTKGNIFAMIKAVEKVKPQNIMLLFTVDEEAGVKTGVKYFLESDYKRGIQRAIVGEPTQLKFVSRHKGYYSFEVEFDAMAKHSSVNTQGAIVKAAKSIVKLDEDTFNIGVINGGVAGNIVSQKCTFKTSKRTYDSEIDVKNKVLELCSGARVSQRFIGPALKNDRPMFVGDFQEVSFWTEASLFQEIGINSIVFGVGSIEQAHSANEFVEKSHIIEAQEKLENIIKGE